ncbi:YhcH/YjgK/YiaL family protein [Flavonifractor sp.]|uniref:YhcH/YjgK/YiaL family protein n=1 Tax=Flavonifractor sp. TaxID=2049025 RepID=UPI0025C5DE09|nr:YhcH/YjgK/YiaL family protein [Flavonifractor sp.]
MIFSKLNGGDDLSAYPAAIQRALAYLRDTDIMSLELGRHELEGDDMFVNVMDMTTHPMEGSHPEIHKKYIDLMYWPEGGERIGVAPYLGTEPVFEARPENDISLLEDVANECMLVATPGCFGIFFPWDAHRPALMLGDAPATSRKAVVKISMALLAR